jgi:hypothetical protein
MRLLRFGLVLALAFVGVSCTSYRLGTGAELAFQTLYLAPVENAASVPQATAPITAELRQAFLRDGRVTLVADPSEADAVLDVRLVRYGRNVATVRPDDTGLARKFDVVLQAECTLRDRRSGRVWFERRPVVASRQVFATLGRPDIERDGRSLVASDQIQAEYQNLPQLASALAERVTHATLDTW